MKLPLPDPQALELSGQLAAVIRDEIEARGGWLPFSEYMQLALYAPGLGYYVAGAPKFGAGGDFITAPELTPLFGTAMARAVADWLPRCGDVVLEFGGGTGLLAADLLASLAAQGALPAHYDIVEVSPTLRVRQRETLMKRVPELVPRVRWLDALPARFRGVVVANEVLDVMPVHALECGADGVQERGVMIDAQGGLCWGVRPAGKMLADVVAGRDIPCPQHGVYRTEVNLAAEAWVREWGERLEAGVVLMIDYGYPRAEFYLPSRASGTLQCYYRHHAHDDPLRWPGLCDITGFVDFSAMADAAFSSGLSVLGYTTQARWLLECGILEALAQRGDERSVEYIRGARAVQRLLAPHEMGELFKVLAVGRGVRAPLMGFEHHDRVHVL